MPANKIEELEKFLDDIQVKLDDYILEVLGNYDTADGDAEVLAKLVVQDVLSKAQFGIGNGGLLDFVEGLMRGILSALEMNFKEVFVALVTPLVDIAVALNPLPEYQFTTMVMDGDLEMRYIEETFENWGLTLLANVTVKTFFPRYSLKDENGVKLYPRTL